MFDQNGDGLISGEELKLTMRSLGETLTEDEVIFFKNIAKGTTDPRVKFILPK